MDTILPPSLPDLPRTRRKAPDLVKDDIILHCTGDTDRAAAIVRSGMRAAPAGPSVPDSPGGRA